MLNNHKLLNVLLLLTILLFGACEQKQEVAQNQSDNSNFHNSDKYLIAKSEIGDVVDIIPARGTFEAVNSVIVGAEVSGKVIKVDVNPDDQVKKGQLLAVLDPEPFAASLNQGRSDIRISKANIRSLQAELAKKQKQLARRSKAKEYLDEPLELIDNLRFDIEALQARIEAAEARLEKDKANLRVREFNLGRTKITAPIDGVVREVNIKQGGNINASFTTPELFVISSDNVNMQVSALISELDVARVKPGQTVKVRPAAMPNTELFASIQSVATSPIRRGNFVSYKVIISFNGLPVPSKVRPGMSASLNIYGQNLRNIARLPLEALYSIKANDFTPDIESLGLSLDDYPNIPKDEAGRKGALWGIAIGYFLRQNKRMVFIIENDQIKIRGIRILGESEDYIAYDEKDLPIGTPVIVGKKNQ